MSLDSTTTLNSTLSTTEVSTIISLPSAIISDEVMRIVTTIAYSIVCQFINVFGIGTNIINMICFVKQGFKDTINISLLALAISDFGCLVTLAWSCICLIPLFQEADLPFNPMDVQYLTAAMPHIVLIRVTSCITALITLERCLCVSMPLKVGQLFTPRRTAYVNISIYTVLIVCVIPLYMGSRYSMKFSPEKNTTILLLVSMANREQLEQITFIITNVIVPFAAFLIIIICMTLMVVMLERQRQWRKSHASATVKVTVNVREQKLTKMVVMISVLFVTCSVPSVMVFVAILLEPEFSFGGRYENVLGFTYSFSAIFESTNSATNIFIYYHMSSRYRAVFRQIFIRESRFVNGT